MNGKLLDRMTEDCRWCKNARACAAALWNALAGSRYLFLTAENCDLENSPFGESVRVCRPVVHCTACGDLGRVLTDEGKEFVTWLEQAGLVESERFKGMIVAYQAAPPKS